MSNLTKWATGSVVAVSLFALPVGVALATSATYSPSPSPSHSPSMSPSPSPSMTPSPTPTPKPTPTPTPKPTPTPSVTPTPTPEVLGTSTTLPDTGALDYASLGFGSVVSAGVYAIARRRANR